MGSTKQRTIVHSTAALNNYPRKHIDAPTISLLRKSIPVKSSKSDLRNPLVGLLDCYLGLTGQTLTFLSLSKNATNNLFSGFIGALCCETFVKASEITRDSYIRSFSRAIEAISAEVPNLVCEFDRGVSLSQWRKFRIDPLQREYYQGWPIKSKTGKCGASLMLAWAWDALGPDLVRVLHANASRFSERYETRSSKNFAPVFNELFAFMELNLPKVTTAHLGDPDFITELIESFCRHFFEQKVATGNCLETTIKRWNDALPFLEGTLLDSGAFARPYRNFPYVEPSRKTGAESKIAMNEHGILVKDKLIVDVPLSLTDDEVIKLLFEKINSEVEIVLNWARRQANSILARHKENSGEFDYMDFDLDPVQIKSKYRTTTLREATIADIAYRLGLPTSYSLEPFFYLLIKEHPQITESFLLGLELYDKHGKPVGLETTDARKYLVGYKRRRGGKKALQRIALSEGAITIVDQVIKLTEPLRSYLKSKGDDNYRFLFLSCRTGFCHPAPIRNPITGNCSSDAAVNVRRMQFIEVVDNGNEKAAEELVMRLSPTRFRATVGLQVFLETGSAKTMSEALGHAKYKPELLSHYLPEPILAFFQSRWIRIFQKGIICEAMKDSALLLRASNFKSIDELDKFLNHYALSLPDSPDESEEKQDKDVREVCICVDENILTALLSLESAVESADQKLVSVKARYWSKFSSLLKVEIEKNTYDPEMCRALNNARNRVDPTLMQGLIYESNVYQGSRS